MDMWNKCVNVKISLLLSIKIQPAQKKSFHYNPLPHPLPLITMIGGAVPVQQNAAEVQPGKVVTLGKAAPATRQMSQFFSARGLSSSTAAAATAGEELCVEIFSFRRH